MSEAANSHFDPDLSESSLSTSSAETVSHPPEPTTVSTEDDWQTVNLPGAISVDAILAGDINLAEMAVASEPSEPASSTATIAQLDQENAALREQIQQLEQDLSQAQIELQLEIARSLYSQPPATIVSAETGQFAPALPEVATLPQIEQLTQELELVQQAAQRQQILVETLTNQLHSSQERIAQLERECALTQQRYNEQMQQLLQSENTCRDLRMRLMRQQQHTLQFKAALEKCLDMPAALQQHPFVRNFELEEQASSDLGTAASQFSHAPFVPKAHPVKPWSTEADSTDGFYTTAGFDLSGLPNLLSRLRHSDDLEDEQENQPLDLAHDSVNYSTIAEFNADSLSADEPQQIGELLNLMFPETTESPAESIAATSPTAEPIFDIRPFIEAEEVPPPAIEQTPEPEAIPLATESQPGANMWDDLAQLIDPATSTESAVTAPVPTDSLLPTSVSELLAAHAIHHPSETIAASEPSPEPPASPVQRPSNRPILLAFPSANTASVHASAELSSEPDSVAAPSSSTWAYPLDQLNQLDAMEAAPGNFDTASAVPANWPSPVLYPLRPTKRLQSLAAVELPTFRRG